MVLSQSKHWQTELWAERKEKRNWLIPIICPWSMFLIFWGAAICMSSLSAVLLNSVLTCQTHRNTSINLEVNFSFFLNQAFCTGLNGQQHQPLQKHFAHPEKHVSLRSRDFLLLATKALKSSKLSPKLLACSLRCLQAAPRKVLLWALHCAWQSSH